MTLENKSVLVTGAGGFIGSHLADSLVSAGAHVRALVHYNALDRRGWLDYSDAAREMDIISGDITDAGCMRSAMAGCDVVFHLAALIGIPYSYTAPASYVRTNIEGTLNILQAARDLETPRLICTSTSEVYGTARTVPIAESHPLQGQSPYSATKIGADKLAEAYHQSFSVPLVVVRPFNTFGPRQSARAVIPTIISQCLNSSVVKLGSLHPTRDLNFIANTVDGFLLAASSDKAIGETINLGSGTEISVRDLAQLIAELLGKKITIESDAMRVRPENSEVDRLLADNTKARELLGWQPTISLREGLERTIGWLRDHQHLYRTGTYVV